LAMASPSYKNRVIQITGESHTGFVYDLSDFNYCGNFLSGDGRKAGALPRAQRTLNSDGTARFESRPRRSRKRRCTVATAFGPSTVECLENVEGGGSSCHSGRTTHCRHSPQLWQGVGWIDLGALRPVYRLDRRGLEGIAYDSNSQTYLGRAHCGPAFSRVEWFRNATSAVVDRAPEKDVDVSLGQPFPVVSPSFFRSD